MTFHNKIIIENATSITPDKENPIRFILFEQDEDTGAWQVKDIIEYDALKDHPMVMSHYALTRIPRHTDFDVEVHCGGHQCGFGSHQNLLTVLEQMTIICNILTLDYLGYKDFLGEIAHPIHYRGEEDPRDLLEAFYEDKDGDDGTYGNVLSRHVSIA